MAEPTTIPLSRRLPSSGRLLAAQVGYQLRLLLRTPRALGAGVAVPALLLLLSNPGHAGVPASHLAGLAVLGVTVTAWVTHGIGLVAAREAGVLKRWRAAPLPPWCYFAGRITATVVVAIAAAAVTVAIGVARYGTRLDAGAAVGLLVAVGLGALAWATPATALTGVIPSVEGASPILTLTYLPVILLSGVFGSLAGQPHWLTTLPGWLPAQPMIDAATRALQHPAGPPVLPGHDLLVLAAWAAAGLVASMVLFRWEPSRPAPRPPTRWGPAVYLRFGLELVESPPAPWRVGAWRRPGTRPAGGAQGDRGGSAARPRGRSAARGRTARPRWPPPPR
jgi:ABC-2 type transport system permease protein